MRSDYTITSRAACIGILFSGAIILSQPAVSCAVDVDVPAQINITSSIEQQKTKDLDFGDVEIMGNGTVKIDAHSGANTVDCTGSSIICTGDSHEGEITVYSASGMDFTIQIEYPISVTLKNGSNTLTIKDIGKNSTGSDTSYAISHTGQGDSTGTKIRVGGQIDLDDPIKGSYLGTVSVRLTYVP